MRIVCHAQHLSGVGHLVRMQAIARGLASAHEVHLVEGGRPVPRPAAASEPTALRLPPLVRRAGRLVAPETDAPVARVLAERMRLLADAVERIRPDVVLVDHYPFSKWELEPEVAAAIEAARRWNERVRVFCSLRDVVRQTRHEEVPAEVYEERVLARLASQFDGVLVHADPAFTRLEEHFGRTAELPVPLRYTGFVAGPAAPPPLRLPSGDPFAVLSCGGGTRGVPFLLAAIEAFRSLERGSMTLLVFPGPFLDHAGVAALRAATTRDGSVRLCDFSPDFAGWLAASALSISRVGYNTSVELLRSNVRAVLVADPEMSDQGPRARRLGELGLATVAEDGSAAAIAAAIEDVLARPQPRHAFDLDGVSRTRALLEAEWPSTDTSASRSTSA